MFKVVEMIRTINGECNAWGQGSPCYLVRFAGCNLECSYCDAKSAQSAEHAKDITAENLWDAIMGNTYPGGIVLITGGEPLLQDNLALWTRVFVPLTQHSRRVIVETNGTIKWDYSVGNELVSWVIDCKLPSSGIERDWSRPWEYAPQITDLRTLRKGQDFIKFVVDMDAPDSYSDDVINADLMMSYLHYHDCKAQFIISPIMSKRSKLDQYTVQQTINWLHDLRKRGIDAALNLQIHKLLGIA